MCIRDSNGAGLNNQQIETCITDPANLQASEDRSQAAVKAGVTGTHAFFVNGVQIAGTSMEDLSRAIDAELAKG